MLGPWPPRLLLAASLATAGAAPTHTKFRTSDDLQEAVNLWCRNATEATQQFGHISTWNVARVTHFNLLFNDKFEFNDDISGWDVSNAVSMVGCSSPHNAHKHATG